MIEIDAKSAQSTIERLARVNKDIEKRFGDFLTVQSKVLEKKIKDEITNVGAVDTGDARRSIHGEAYGLEAQVKANQLHASIIEYGRRPGTYPPSEPIRRWLARKGIDIPAYIIVRKIKRDGIKARPFFYPTWINYKGTFNRKMIALFKQIVQK